MLKGKKRTKLRFTALMPMALFLALSPGALAATTWYVNGVNGNDGNNGLTAATACRTIRRAISLAVSGDSINIAPAVYHENLTISSNLKLTGSSARTTIIDGGRIRVISINTSAHVTLSNLTIRNGSAAGGGGILNLGYLTLSKCAITGNSASSESSAVGGGIESSGTLTVSNSTFSGNTAAANFVYGVAIYSSGTLTVSNSTFSGNTAAANFVYGGAIYVSGPLLMYNSTVSGNSARGRLGGGGGGIYTAGGATRISSTTVAGNSANSGGGIYKSGGTVLIQNSIVSGSSSGGNCFGTMTSYGYNLSSDGTCTFHGSLDRNKINPMLGTLGNYGGPTNTMVLLPGSPAIDTGNPSGCTDGSGHLLKTDQRGYPRHDPEDVGGCDRGAFERQSD